MPNIHGIAGMANYRLYKSCIGNDRLLDLHVSSSNSRKRKSQETEEKKKKLGRKYGAIRGSCNRVESFGSERLNAIASH